MIRSEDGSRPARLALPDAERLIRLVGAAPMAPEAHLAAWEATALAALHGESGDVEAWALPHPGDGWEAHARLLPSALRPWVPARWWHRPEPDAEADRAGLDRLLASGR